jgi:pimeloyl-ACP methyl ester carboxylesterase
MAKPEIQYCTTKDGVSIAYYEMGEGPPLVLPSNVLGSHLRYWAVPEYHRSGSGIGRYNRIIRYDSRGTGLSDRSSLDYSLTARIADLEGVVTHLRLERFDLFGIGHGGQAAIAYASYHPDRVTHLVLWGPFASGAEFQRQTPSFESLRTTIRDETDWERYTLVMANFNLGFTNTELANGLARAFRES